jgi:hypothetical protein
MHLGLNMPNIFCMNAFGIYVNKAMGHKNIQTHNHFDSSSCQSISMSAATIMHMHWAPQQSWQSLPVPLVAIVERVSMVPSILAQISHVPKAWHSKRPHFMLVSCWTFSMHPLCPTFDVYISETMTCKHTRLPNNCLLKNTPAFFHCFYTSTCIQQAHECDRLRVQSFCFLRQ